MIGPSGNVRVYLACGPTDTQALEFSCEVLGARHPDTLLTQLNLVSNQVAADKPAAGLRLLAEMEGPLLTWLGAEIYSTESVTVRRQLVASQSTYQHVALSAALRYPDLAQAQEVEVSALLRFKGLGPLRSRHSNHFRH